jgi:hypothetical protein
MFEDANRIGVEIQKNINIKYKEEILKIKQAIEDAKENMNFKFFVRGSISQKVIQELETANYIVEVHENYINVEIPKPDYNV